MEGTGTPWTSVMCIPDKRGNVDMFDKIGSAVVVQPLSNATYTMAYGGRGCGICYVFASPYTFDLDAPTKTVNIAPIENQYKIYEEKTYNYMISQYVPNNYYSDVLNFIGQVGGKYREFRIIDDLSIHLNVNRSGIRVVNESGQDVTSYFDITDRKSVV